jgi:hypothetical protein
VASSRTALGRALIYSFASDANHPKEPLEWTETTSPGKQVTPPMPSFAAVGYDFRRLLAWFALLLSAIGILLFHPNRSKPNCLTA